MPEVRPKIDPSWRKALSAEFDKPYFEELKGFLVKEKAHYQIYPPGSKIFAAFNATPFNSVEVVIIGQDPYHGTGQANGLCFSVERGAKVPPSLQNIHKEMMSDLGYQQPPHGDLSKWAENGVLLLNTVLTVRKGEPASHRKKGWERFTDAVIKALSEKREGLIFILWGNFARSKKTLIDTSSHYIIESPHPSPFSAHSGFFGSHPFSKANAMLAQQNKKPIDWEI